MIMTKKIFFFIIGLCIFTALLGGLLAFRRIENQKRNEQAIKNAKAPESTITIIEGWTTKDISDYLQGQKLIKAGDFLALQQKFDVSKYPLLAQNPANADLEGFLFPDTYRIFKPKNNFDPKTGDDIITKMLENFSGKFTIQMQNEAASLHMTVFQIITLASIIEKETGRNAITTEQKQKLDEERKTIAGIFYNRLKANYPLESDATINYITQKNNPTPTQEDLDTSSPYNTYKNKGLPPGPICNPSLSSIKAALEPMTTDYFYFLHKQPSGEPVYSKTFEEHIKNKLKYLK